MAHVRGVWVFVAGTVAAIAVIATFAFYFGQNATAFGVAGSGPATLVGAPAQSFPIKRSDGVMDSLEHYRGHVVLVNLWASWCTPCRTETPALEQLFEENRANGLVVLGINQGESAEAATRFARELKLTYPILLDEEQRYGRAYAAVGLPTSLLVDRAGHIVRGFDGELSLGQMRGAVAPLLHAK